MNGLIVVNKPSGMTSRDVVNVLSKKFGIKKVGHNGTLDPLASGVLVVCFGRYTKLNDLLSSEDKSYVAGVKLGFETDTLDTEGAVLFTDDYDVSYDSIKNTLKFFEGEYLQEVPKYSAIKVNGKKLYEYAREGIDVSLPKRMVKVEGMKLLSFDNDNFVFSCNVSKGTYIRSLIRDICHKMGTLGTMCDLVRTKQGVFNLDMSCDLEDILNDDYNFLYIKDILDIEKVIVSEEDKHKIINGAKMDYNYEEVLFLDSDLNELAIYKKCDGELRMYVLLYDGD